MIMGGIQPFIQRQVLHMATRKAPLIKPGATLREYAPEQAQAMAQQWLDVYGKHRQGSNSKAYLWHIFAAGCYPCLCGSEADVAYAGQVAAEYVVLSNDRDFAFATDRLPEACSLFDYLVFPPNLAWTMALTHEDGWMGPYFATHPRYAGLDAANKAAIRKLEEVAQARLKGWC